MASDILSLFSGPQKVRDDYYASQRITPQQMASQGLNQQIISLGNNAGAGVGQALGTLFGVEVPGEAQAKVLDQAMQESAGNTEMTQSERLSRMAEILAQQPGMGAQAMEALKAARAAQLQELQMKKSEQDLNPPYKDFKVETTGYEDDGRGGRVPVRKYITVTRKYNPKTGQYEDMTPQEAKESGIASAASQTIAEKAAAERARRQAAGAYTNPVPTPNMPQATAIPPSGSRGRTTGFEGQGMINPEGF
jgi:hypothetical protein